jgi:hypothetical protein
MATRRKATSKAPPRKAKRRVVKVAGKATRGCSAAVAPLAMATETAAPETAEQAITHIAQDAVVILRRELAYRAELCLSSPGRISMSDLVALLRLTADLGVAAMRDEDGQAQRADFSRLSPEERAQFAALMLKVDYA